MKSLLLRTGSVQPHAPLTPGGSSKLSLSRSSSVTSFLSGEKNSSSSPNISLHLDINRRSSRDAPIRRAFSEADIVRSETEIFGSFPASIVEEESLDLNFDGLLWSESGGDGFGKGKNSGGGGGAGSGGADDLRKIGDNYKKMLKSNPSDSLLLRNYGKFLQEVEGDMEKAEEYYGRAILANPGDGEVLCLYGKLIWDHQKDGERAKSYFDQALSASPHDSMVMGSYAHFMWEAEEDEEDDDVNSKVLGGPFAKKHKVEWL
ncbi:uncharacterized protein LOC126680165 [Mercurialis annua]|uniref:uncharacterized protein LOC126680165 n=1 Tax=Mercurialis annua TaxID=3986 RepID=UPI00215F2A2B|nr:uncharacterized protein LOC126680165 [Mercurialis annua]